MKKLETTFKINPLYEADGYKVGHPNMIAPNTVREAFNWIPRNLKYMHPSIDQIMSGGQQMVWRYIHSHFKEFFFDKPESEVEKFGRDMTAYLMQPYNSKHFHDLYRLGYLPVTIQSLPEGIFTNPNIPHIQGITEDGFAWLGLYLETLMSKLAWQLPTAATLGAKFKQNAVKWVKKTDEENLWLADFMCHDFHSRGGNPFTSIAVGLGHAFSNSGSDTLNIIPASRYYYDFGDEDMPIYSVNASEHSVTCTGIFFYEKKLREGMLDLEIEKYYSFDVACEGSVEKPDYLAIAELLNLRDWLKKFPNGALSVVSDTMDLWKVCTHILPRLKEEILARDGKLVIRPDSGDPVDIICGKGYGTLLDYGNYKGYRDYSPNDTRVSSENEWKGVIELLWDIFGGNTNNQGYKVLDSHIGVIYGDSINLDRQLSIYERLSDKSFAATNILVGIGSFSYVYMTRDQAGYAAKGSWFETEEKAVGGNGETHREQFNIYKDPITDDGTKKSLKGFQFVYVDVDGVIVTQGESSEEVAFSENNLLKTIYKNGNFYNQTTLTEIRERLNS